MLLARLQCQSIRGLSVAVDGHADQPPGKAALEFVARREKRRVRPAESHRHAEALARADDDVRAPFARRGKQRQRQQIGGDEDERAARVQRVRKSAIVAHVAIDARVLQQHRKAIRLRGRRGGSDDDIEAERLRARAHDVDRLRQNVVRDPDRVARALADATRKRHRFRRGRRLVEHRRVGDGEPGEVAHHRLEIDECLEPALRYLRLVGRIRRVPRGVLEHVTQDHARRQRAVIALADKRFQHVVLARDCLQLVERLLLALRGRQGQRLAQTARPHR